MIGVDDERQQGTKRDAWRHPRRADRGRPRNIPAQWGGNTWAKRPSTATLICPRSPRAKGNKQKLARSVPRMQRVAGRRAGRLSDRTLGGSLSLNERDARMSARLRAATDAREREVASRCSPAAVSPGFLPRPC